MIKNRIAKCDYEVKMVKNCGQISFPFIGPLWVPTEAPEEAHCGLYQDNMRTVFTTSGVGTTILPIRYGAQSNWDLLTINVN